MTEQERQAAYDKWVTNWEESWQKVKQDEVAWLSFIQHLGKRRKKK